MEGIRYVMIASRLVGTGTKLGFLAPVEAPTYKLEGEGLLEIAAADQTVTVSADVAVADLQVALAERAQSLPLPDPAEWGDLLAGVPGTVGGLLAMDMPHALSAQCGGPRDWLLQAEVLFRGEVAKAGAKVVKSVAGYDVHKAFVGSRGLLGPIVRVTFKTWPKRALPTPKAVRHEESHDGDVWILRTLPSLFQAQLEQSEGVIAHDPASCTLWAATRPPEPAEGWIVGPRGAVWRDRPAPEVERRLKSVFDPDDQWL